MRFPEFSGEWKEYRISEFLDFFSTNSLSWDQLEYTNGDMLNLHYGLIHKGLPTCIDMQSQRLPAIKSNKIPNTYTLCKNGDVVFADASEDTNDIAKVIEFVNCEDEQVVSGLHTIHGRDKLDITSVGFKGYAFTAPVFRNQIRKIAQGTKVYSISVKNFSECKMRIPTKDEQQKIASLLSLIDERISTQIKIIEELESLVKGLRADIVNSLGNCEWLKLDKLVEQNIIKLGRGQIIPKYGYSKEYCYPVYSSSIHKQGLMGYYNSYMFDEELISWSVDGGGNFFYRPRHKFNVTNVSGYIRIDTSLNNYRFIAEMLIHQHSMKLFDYQSKAHPSVIVGLYELPIIPIEKQNVFASLFESIYAKIDNRKRVLELFREQKQYLLSNLFI